MNEVMSADISKFASDYEKNTGFKLVFDLSARRAIIAKAVEADKSAVSVCSELFKEISADCIADSDKWLSDKVVKSFDRK